MKSIFEALDEISHQLNSPLAGAKSYVYLARRFLEKGDTKKSADYLDLLDTKIDLLTRRIDMVLTSIRLETSTVPLTYELFNISYLIEDVSFDIELIADKSILMRVIEYSRYLTGAKTISVRGAKKLVSLTFPYANRPTSDDKDVRTEILEKAILVHQMVKIHGGRVEDSEKDLTIELPLKPSKKK